MSPQCLRGSQPRSSLRPQRPCQGQRDVSGLQQGYCFLIDFHPSSRLLFLIYRLIAISNSMTPSSSILGYPTNCCEYHLHWLERIRRETCCCWAICSLRGRYHGWLPVASSSLTWCETLPVWIFSLRNSWRQSSRRHIPSQRSLTKELSYSSM